MMSETTPKTIFDPETLAAIREIERAPEGGWIITSKNYPCYGSVSEPIEAGNEIEAALLWYDTELADANDTIDALNDERSSAISESAIRTIHECQAAGGKLHFNEGIKCDHLYRYAKLLNITCRVLPIVNCLYLAESEESMIAQHGEEQ